MDNYILVGKEVIPEPDVKKWGEWLQTAKNRIVAKEQVGDSEVSTVFLGLNHAYGDEQPLLFETMIFGGSLDENQWRYHTYDEALDGHAKAVEEVKRHIGC